MQNLSIELRPKTFSEVIGNKKVVSALRTQIESGNIPTSFMFSGESGTGKTTLAGIVAKAVQGKDFDGEPEVKNINAADTRGIDDIRELVSRVDYLPLVGKYSIIILNEAQQLTDAAQNVLLDPMEKKNSPTIFIITTTDPKKLLPALKNRCMSFQLTGLNKEERKELVNDVLAAIPSFEDPDVLLSAMDKANITAPRDIVMMAEKYANGISADMAVQNPEVSSELSDIAALVCSGKWNSVAPLLKNVKPADSKNLRTVLSAYMRNRLLSNPSDAPANFLKELALYQTVEAGCDLGALIAVIYSYCKKHL
jgi:DNA polymerase-3 subunit gamma/tau